MSCYSIIEGHAGRPSRDEREARRLGEAVEERHGLGDQYNSSNSNLDNMNNSSIKNITI